MRRIGVGVPDESPARARPGGSLSRAASIYIAAITAAAAAAALLAARGWLNQGTHEAILTVILAVSATIAQLSEVRTANNRAYVGTIAFLFAGVLLLPPTAAALVVPLPFLVELLIKRKPVYMQLFNIASQALCVLCASSSYHAVGGVAMGAPVTGAARSVGGILAGLTVFLIINHATVAIAVWLARGVRPNAAGLVGLDSLVPDLGLLALGVVIASLWALAPALVVFAVVPFVLLQRALHFPALRQASRTDPKTGLANAAWFTEQADAELRRADRAGHLVSVLVADLDLLRNINNAYGHLAGDVVLRGVADVLRREIREYDIPCRFGGEEFAVLLPAADEQEALAVAERIRREVAREDIEVPTSLTPLHVTVSIGVATLTTHGTTLKQLIHAADLALYRAKVEGRDRVRVAREGETAETAPGPALAIRIAPESRLLTALTGEGVADVAAEPAPTNVVPLIPSEDPTPAPAHPPVRPEWTADSAPRSARRRTWPVTALVTLAAAASVVGVIRLQPTTALLVFPALALAAERFREEVYGSSMVSLSAVPLLAAAAAGRPLAAIVGALVVGLSGVVTYRRRRLEQHVFNLANITLATAVGAGLRSAVHLSPHTGVALLELMPLAVAMALVYFVIDNGLVALVVARDEGRRPGDVFRSDFAWLGPHFAGYGLLAGLLAAAWSSFGVWGLAVFLTPIALLRLAQRQYLTRTTRNVRELRRLAEDLANSKADVEATNAKLQVALASVSDAHRRTAAALAGAIDARDATTGGHIERVTALGLALCEIIDPGLAADPQVAFGFLLHDVGKIGVPDAVLLKNGPLTPEEIAVIREHPAVGERLVDAAGFATVTREIVISHHERWDGSGYPRGLRGTEIPLCARLFAVADAMDAMVSDRPYRSGLALEQAYEELRTGAGSQFDPMAVEALMSLDPTRVTALLRLSAERLLDTLARGQSA
jgi:diguanylate cyclase (GGDEF)-like protein